MSLRANAFSFITGQKYEEKINKQDKEKKSCGLRVTGYWLNPGGVE
jgi:hypothetical protein